MPPLNHRIPHDDWKFRNIVHIAHGDLFNSLDLNRPTLKAVQSAVEKQDWQAAYAAWDNYFTNKKKHLNFFDPDEFQALVQSRPQQIRQHRKEADEICNHRIHWYGPRLEQFGDIVNFDPGEDRSAIYGFHYWYWSHPLLFSWAVDRNPKYAEAFDRLFSQWYDQRDSVSWRVPNLDPIWYELGLCRTNLFIAYYSLFRNEPCLRPATRERLVRSLLGHGRALFGFVNKTGTPGNNSQFNGVLALTHLALAMPEFKESKRWINTSLKALQRHLKNAVYADGGFTERCPSYASFSLGFATEIYRLLESFPEHTTTRKKIGALLRPSYDWYMNIITPLGEFPPFGDARTRSAVPMLTGGIAPLDLDELHTVLAPNITRVAREKLTLQYTHRAREADLTHQKVQPDALPDYTSKHLPDSHWTVMRSGWKPTDRYLILNHGPIAGHAHREALAFTCYAFGEPHALELDLAVELGYDDPKCDFTRSSRSHNMLVLDDECVERTHNPIDLWTGQDVVWHTDEHIDYFQAYHRGYQRTKNAIVTRTILFIKPHFWLVHDRVTLQKSSTAKTASFYLHACNPFEPRATGWTSTGNKSRLDVIPAQTPGKLTSETAQESRMSPEGMKDAMYQNYYPNRFFLRLTHRLTGKGPHDHCVILHPRRKSDRITVTTEPVVLTRNGKPVNPEDAQVWKITRGKQQYLILLNHTGKKVELNGQTFTARAVVLHGKRTHIVS